MRLKLEKKEHPQQGYADLEAIHIGLERAKGHGLEIEVIRSAMLAIYEKPSLSIEEAMAIGLDEWDI